MSNGLIGTAARAQAPRDRRIYGVTVGEVVENIDTTGQGRVKIRLPWLPSIEPWCRVAVPMAGAERGFYFIPQVGDEVLVAFNHGDIREPYIIGCLWNGQDSPPTQVPTDAVNKRIIRTPAGHQIELDDAAQSITITSTTDHKVTIDPEKIELATARDTVTLSLSTEGGVSIEAKTSLELKAKKIRIEGTVIDIQGDTSTSINGGNLCDIQASLVRIN
jgi:phage baseplate assembly protein V